MYRNRLILAIVGCALLVACQARDMDRREAASTTGSSASGSQGAGVEKKESDVESNLEDVLKKDMAYADLRKVVLAKGWTPVKSAECKVNVGGEALICDQLPELESCSGDGYCISHFQNSSGERLDVTSYGMSEDWNVSGDDSRFNVIEWSFSKAPGR